MKSHLINFFRKRSIRVTIRPETEAKIHRVSVRAAPRETGGLLLGWWEEGGIVIEDAVVVVDSSATGNSWVRNQVQAQTALDRAKQIHGFEKLGFVGDWHCHPANIGASSTDIRSLKAMSEQYELPVVLIVRKANKSLELHVAQRGKKQSIKLIR